VPVQLELIGFGCVKYLRFRDSQIKKSRQMNPPLRVVDGKCVLLTKGGRPAATVDQLALTTVNDFGGQVDTPAFVFS
jgi:hypothetical protein